MSFYQSIGEDTCLQVCNEILSQRIGKQIFPVKKGVVGCIVRKNRDLLRLIHGNSIDPKRVRQTLTDKQNSMFVMLESMIKLLHSQGKILCSSFADIPAENISNMDD